MTEESEVIVHRIVMTKESEIMVQRILGLLGYTDEDVIDQGLFETLNRAYKDIALLQDQARVGEAYIIAADAVGDYLERHR